MQGLEIWLTAEVEEEDGGAMEIERKLFVSTELFGKRWNQRKRKEMKTTERKEEKVRKRMKKSA